MRNKLGSFNIYLEFLKVLLFTICTLGLIAILHPRYIVDHIEDIISGPSKVVGPVTKMDFYELVSSFEGHVDRSMNYYIKVDEVNFQVSREIFHSLSEGDEVSVSHWSHTKTVSRVDIVKQKTEVEKAQTARKASEQAIARFKRQYKQDAEDRNK